MTDWALELAENPNTYVPLRHGSDRFLTDRYVLWLGGGDYPAWNVAQRFRFRADELDEVRSEIHDHVRAKGRTACSWEVGSSATPADLVDRLLELGLVEDDEPLRVGMALTTPPPGRPEVEVRPAETDGDRRLAETIAANVYGTPFREPSPPDPHTVVYLAYLDGEPVGRATGSFSEHGVTLFGAAVLPEARGRGAYRALVHARWEDAVSRGTPLAVTDAGSQSRPILARMGFRELCMIRALIDRFD
jgi:GNAT superfamily N-acetyltransferase